MNEIVQSWRRVSKASPPCLRPASKSMAAKTEDTARIVVESKQSVPVFPPIRIGACGSDNYQTVEIVADDRERPSGMVAELQKAGQAIVKIERLSVGDYCVDGAVLIERKTALDFAQSLMEGRLFTKPLGSRVHLFDRPTLSREQALNGPDLGYRERHCKAPL